MTGTEPPSQPEAIRRSKGALLRNVAVLSGSQLVTWGATLLWALFVPRAIGPREMGIFTLGAAAGGVLTVVIGLGMRPLLVREIATDPTRAPRLIADAILLRLFIAAPTLGVVCLLAVFGPFEHDEAIALYLGWGMCIFYALYEPIQAAFQALERMQYLAYADMLTKGAVSIVAIGIVTLGGRAFSLLIASITVMLLVLVLNVVWLRRHLHVVWVVDPAALRSLFAASLPYWSFAAFFTIYLWIDSLMLAVMAPSTVLGWYGLPTKLFGTLMFVPVILSTACLPRLVQAHAAGGDRLWHASRAPLEYVMILALPISAGTILVAGPLIRFLYGSGFEQSVPVLVVLALCVPPMYLNIMVAQVLVAAGRQMLWTRVMMLATVVNPLINLGLIRYFQQTRGNGAIGAALSLLLTELMIVAIGAMLVHRAFDGAALRRLARAVIATAGMAAPALAVRRLGVVVTVLVAAATFCLLAAGLRVVSRRDIDEVRRAALEVRTRRRAAVPTP